MTDKGFRYLALGLLISQTVLLILSGYRDRHDRDQHAQQIAAAVLAQLAVADPGTTPTSDGPQTTSSSALSPLLQQQIRSVIRSELTTFSATLKANRSTVMDPPRPTLLTAEQQREQQNQFAQSEAVLDTALSLGVWTERDTRNLIPHLSSLSGAQRLQLLEKFHGAVNRQELKLEDVPPL
jgi:hypothetical protein